MKSLISDVPRDFSEAHFSCAFEAQPFLTLVSCFPGELVPWATFCTVLIFKDSEENRAVGEANEKPWGLQEGDTFLTELPLISLWRQMSYMLARAGKYW